MEQKRKRYWIALSVGLFCFALLWFCLPPTDLGGVIALILMAGFGAMTTNSLLCSRELNDVQVALHDGEDIVGRTMQCFYFRENSWLWYIKRNPLPLGGSIIVTTRKIMFYYDVSWYDEILLKDLLAVEWTEEQELYFRYRQGGTERGMRVMTWLGSYEPLLQLISRAGISVPEKPKKTSTTLGTPN